MAYISFQPSDFFSPTLYTGTGSEITVTGVGFQPDMTWLKDRSATQHHQLYDSARGAGEVIYPNLSNAEGTVTQQLKSWTSDGYVIGTDGSVNTSSNLYASWNWKAGTTSVPSGGTITPTACSFNTTSGFGIYKYAGNGTDPATIAHGLGVAPKMIIVKKLSGAASWAVGHIAATFDYYANLNATDQFYDNDGYWSDDAPTSTVFTIGSDGLVNTNAQDYVAYVWAPVKGYSSFGAYTGNGNADGTFVYTGFRPSLVITKYTSGGGTGGWNIQDDKRNTYNPVDTILSANTDGADSTSSGNAMDFLSNGFKWRANYSDGNTSGGFFSYAAFAEFPLVSSNDMPGVAR